MKSDKQKRGLRGPVKEVLIETAKFEERDGYITETPWFSHTITFNRYGQVIEYVNRNPDGSEWRTVNHYSDSGNLLATSNFDSSGAPNGEVNYLYDIEGRLVAEQHISPDGKVTTPTTYAYDGMNRKVKMQELDFPGSASVMVQIEDTSTSIMAGELKRVESQYDDQGHVVKVRVFNTAGALVRRVEITRDALGNSLEETQYVGEVIPFGQCAGDLCSAEDGAVPTDEQKAELAAEIALLFAPGTTLSKHTHSYDAEGRLVESTLTMMGMQASRLTFAYDKQGNRSEETSYNEDGTLESRALLERKYDEHGNWIKEIVSTASSWDTEFGLSTRDHVTRRSITYFD